MDNLSDSPESERTEDTQTDTEQTQPKGNFSYSSFLSPWLGFPKIWTVPVFWVCWKHRGVRVRGIEVRCWRKGLGRLGDLGHHAERSTPWRICEIHLFLPSCKIWGFHSLRQQQSLRGFCRFCGVTLQMDGWNQRIGSPNYFHTFIQPSTYRF